MGLIEDKTPYQSNSRDWLIVPCVRPEASVRLFCLPYAGGSPWIFRAWPDRLPDIEIQMMCLPGRGRRIKEQMPDTLADLARDMARAMAAGLDKPYALFGHSFGAICTYELTRELERLSLPQPTHVFVSGCSAVDRSVSRLLPINLSDRELAAEIDRRIGLPLGVQGNAQVLAMTLAMIRSDVGLLDNTSMDLQPISAPLTAFYGLDDAETPADDVAAWAQLTRSSFEAISYPGGHFFLHEYSENLLDDINRILNRSAQYPCFS